LPRSASLWARCAPSPTSCAARTGSSSEAWSTRRFREGCTATRAKRGSACTGGDRSAREPERSPCARRPPRCGALWGWTPREALQLRALSTEGKHAWNSLPPGASSTWAAASPSSPARAGAWVSLWLAVWAGRARWWCSTAANQGRLESARARLEGEGIRARAAPFDFTRRDEVSKGVDEIERTVGPIGILINNAGTNLRGKLEEFEEERWHEVIDTNLTSAFLVGQQVGKRMVERRGGKIINICSLMSELGRATTAPYAASKGGLKMLTRAMATEWARHNIQVNGIGPGYFVTDLTRVLAENKEFDSWVKARTPAARWGEPEELVGTAVFLASRASDFVSGQIIYVDGGILASL